MSGSPAHAEFPRIRALDAAVANLLAVGYAESPTFRDVIDRLKQSDLVVHVEQWPLTSHRMISGMLRFVTHAGGFRYLRITLLARLPRDAAVALLGHELQHALEVADDASVVNHVAFEALYRRIGELCHAGHESRSYDTAAAREVQDRIASELRASATRIVARR